MHLSVNFVESLLPPNSQGKINKFDHQKHLLGNCERTNMPDYLMGDERRLKQVLINLVKNAFKFTKEGYIQIQACYNKEECLLIVYVIDTGAGIAEEDFPKLFTRFGKLHRTAHQNQEGIGLGLTIVKEIVEASGGDISFHSDGAGLGSTFCFSMISTEV